MERSTDSVDSMRSRRRRRTTQELGRSKVKWPGSGGQLSFDLATHWTGQGSLRHYVYGLSKLESHYRESELLTVGGRSVKGLPHIAVCGFLQEMFATECKMELLVTDEMGRKHRVEAQIDIIFEDGVGDKVRQAFNIIIRLVDNIITKPDVTDLAYEQCDCIRVRHGANTGRYLRVRADTTLSMDVPVSLNDYVFNCYKFWGHVRSGGGANHGGDDGSWCQLCVLQESRSLRYVVAKAWNKRLKAGNLLTDMQSIQKPDPRFFILHHSGDGDYRQYCLRSLDLYNDFLRYDRCCGLQLVRCDIPPYEDPARVRFFSFEFVPAHTP
ncbi:uncharacterized protein LOC143288880 isoform X2 [Babylonia areolata]|uniref:uncharacterized protein LOC143288880 isoform X2 n=1 Tax=Babylonia areolata TaxID=304850 RepID=UPI003FD3A747